jgi:hypothetical protein
VRGLPRRRDFSFLPQAGADPRLRSDLGVVRKSEPMSGPPVIAFALSLLSKGSSSTMKGE